MVKFVIFKSIVDEICATSIELAPGIVYRLIINHASVGGKWNPTGGARHS
jgi:hypothetical protein